MSDTLTDTITISLRIENAYSCGPTVITTVTDEVIPAPPAGEQGDPDYDDWAYDHVYQFTGTGQTSGDAFYDVEVTACSDSALVGAKFEWGY